VSGNRDRSTNRRTLVIKRLAAIAVLAGLFVVARAPAAHACSCALRPVAEVVETGDGAFVGTVSNVPDTRNVTNSGAPVTWRFRVEWVVKGDVPRDVDVSSAAFGASCGIEGVREDERVGLVLREQGGGWSAGLCDQVDAGELRAMPGSPPSRAAHANPLTVHRVIDAPTAAPVAGSPDSSGGDRAWGLVGAGCVLGIAVVGLVGWSNGRRRSVPEPPD
jgi:hypothetical protein